MRNIVMGLERMLRVHPCLCGNRGFLVKPNPTHPGGRRSVTSGGVFAYQPSGWCAHVTRCGCILMRVGAVDTALTFFVGELEGVHISYFFLYCNEHGRGNAHVSCNSTKKNNLYFSIVHLTGFLVCVSRLVTGDFRSRGKVKGVSYS